MNSEKWLEIIFGVIVIGGLAFLGTNLFDMKGTVSTIEAKLDNTESRVGRIADVLPEVKARIAQEEVNSALSGFVAVTKPKNIDKEWITNTLIYDRDSRRITVYKISLNEAHKDYAGYVIAGKIKTEGVNDSSFSELAMHSAELDGVVVLPANIDPDKSFIIRSGNIEKLIDYASELTQEVSRTADFERIRNWNELKEKLDEVSEIAESNK
jgi:hypothetical protein